MSRKIIRMTIHDAEHYTAEQRAAIIASYPAHQREARANGVPMMGSGVIYPIADEDIACDQIAIPDHWAQIGGLDFGWDHPFAAVSLAWDRDDDVVYVTRTYRKSEATPVIHVAAIKPWGEWLPWAWPHDGLQHDKGSGEALAGQYRDQGLNMLPERATFADGGSGVEAGIAEILSRMETGRFKVFRHLSDWFGEKAIYHRKDGRVVKMRDDLLSATRYAVMMLRFAEAKPRPKAAGRGFGAGAWMG